MKTRMMMIAFPAVILAGTLGMAGCSQTNSSPARVSSSAAEESGQISSTMPTESNTPAPPSVSASILVQEEDAQQSDRYGSFGGAGEAGDSPQEAPEEITPQQKAAGNELAKSVIAHWIGDHSSSSDWRGKLSGVGSTAFDEQVRMTDPKLIEQGEVTGVDSSEVVNGQLETTVKSTAGNYVVISGVNAGTGDMEVYSVSAAWRNKS